MKSKQSVHQTVNRPVWWLTLANLWQSWQIKRQQIPKLSPQHTGGLVTKYISMWWQYLCLWGGGDSLVQAPLNTNKLNLKCGVLSRSLEAQNIYRGECLIRAFFYFWLEHWPKHENYDKITKKISWMYWHQIDLLQFELITINNFMMTRLGWRHCLHWLQHFNWN